MKRIFTLLSIMFSVGAAFAQIPNAGFETWTTVTAVPSSYHVATGWDSPNPTTALTGTGIFTCDSGMDMPPVGTAYMKLTTKTVTGVGLVPGVAATGTIVVSPPTYTVKGGFINTTRPANLTGKWKHKPWGTDHGRVGLYLWKWNTTLNKRDTVALADTVLTGSSTTWSSFTIPIKYFKGWSPDSALIVMSSSATSTSMADTSYLYADDLAFTGSVPNGIITVETPNAASTLFPNPASGSTTVYYHSTATKEITINLADLNGRIVKSINPRAIAGENNFTLDLKGVAQGLYFVQIVDEYGVLQKKLMVE